MTIDDSVPASLQGLKPFPLEGFSEKSQVAPGKYSVGAPGTNGKQPLVEASGSDIVTTTWFKTPVCYTFKDYGRKCFPANNSYYQSLNKHLIKYLQGVQLHTETHDQGYVTDRAQGNWTWLELAIYENESSDSPRVKEDVELLWQSHRNSMGSKEFVWLPGDQFGQKHDIFTNLEEGNVIAVRACACYPGWKLYGRDARLVLEIGEHANDEQPPSYEAVAQTTEKMLTLLNAKNMENNAYTPIVKTVPGRADSYDGKGKDPLLVLSLDGGGVRGYSTLVLLKKVMDSVGRERPCEVFDMIGGTSTGGLIALMLGRLKMTVQECLDEYKELMGEVFGSGWIDDYILKPGRYIKNKDFHSADKFEKVIKDLLRRKLPGVKNPEDALLMDDSNDTCKIFLMAVHQESGSNTAPVFLRSYTSFSDPPPDDLRKIKVWEAARATSAAPGYFQPMKIGKYTFVDGGLLANNPIGWLWTEVLAEYGQLREADCFLSIGTGMAPNVPIEQPGLTFVQAMLSFASVATNTESTHLLFSGLIKAFAPRPGAEKYWRLNVARDPPEKSWFRGIVDKVFGPKDSPLRNYDSPGELDSVKAIEKLKEWTEEWIEAQQFVIGKCTAAIQQRLDARNGLGR